MYGRNGVDQLGFVTLWAAIILDVVNLFVRNQVAYSILSAVAMVLTIWMVFRMFSKNLSKRRAENAAYMNKVVYPLRQALSRSRDKEHKYFTCPNCRTVCRVPRGKGRIVITCPKCGAPMRQDEDVLDTWFSSWLWPISLFDGINNPGNEEINYYYPTSDLVTGPDIIFFWVARMIMAGYEYRGKMPFKSVYFTGIVRDKLGRKMSKSLGNSPDPLQLIEQYGADGVRMGLMLAAPAGNDIPFDDALCEQGRNFNNKIWNAFRLVKGWTVDDTIAQPEASAIAVKWFKMQLDKTIAEVDDSFSKYRLSEAMMAVYKLFWDEFSSWYLEMVKPGYQQPIDKATYEATLGFFDALLRLLHPFMPFITEELWQALEPRKEGESLMVAQMPEVAVADSAYLDAFEIVKEIVGGVRTIRLQKNIPNKDALELQIVGEHNEAFNAVIAKMCNLSSISKVEEKAAGAVSFLVRTTEYAVPLGNLINVEEELAKLQEELKYQKGFLASVMKKLGNENFVSKAPAKVIEMEKKKQADAESKIKSIEESIAALTK